MKPVPKVQAVGVVGSVVFLAVAVASRFGVEITAEEASALTVVLMFLAGYLKS